MTALAVLGAIGGVPLLMFFSSLFNGYALSVLWEWFVVPTFNAPTLGVVPAVGIAMVVSYLTHQIHDCEKPEREISEEVTRAIVYAIVKPTFSLFFGWVVHLFM